MDEMAYYHDVDFVDDHPSSSDEFLGQPHQRVAKALASILSSGDGGRAIGLEGPWGSGKSTVVDIARSELAEQDRAAQNGIKHTFFVFDAWAHQSDPLRRVFLEELILRLDASQAVDKEKWNNNLELLQTRKKKVTETRAEKLSLVAISAILTIPLIPILAILASKPEKTLSFCLPFLSCVSMSSWLPVSVVTSIPYVAASITWLTWRAGWMRSKKVWTGSWWDTKIAKKGKSVIWAFTRQTDHVTTEQFIREEEATTIEFNKIFDDLITDAAQHNHQVVIVFDNLDRLPADLIQTAWATMRNFFVSTPGTTRQATLKNVWLIVPFDRTHIEAVFGKDKEDENGDTAPGFIEKTFEVVLRVAPPIMSDWRDFLSSKLRESFRSTITETEIYQIFKVYELYCRIHTKPITPRSIKAFINTIAVQSRQWGRLIPPEHQALYALYKSDISRNSQKLQESSIIDEPIASRLSDQNWVKSLAAAHYNVHPDSALEILLSPRIQRAIETDDVGLLTTLQNTNGFSVVLHDLLSQKAPAWASERPSALFDTAAILADVTISEEAVRVAIWQTMISQISEIDKPIPPTDHIVPGLKALVTHSGPENEAKTAQLLVDALSPSRPDLPILQGDTGHRFYSLFVAIDDALSVQIPDTARAEIFKGIPVVADISYLFDVAVAAGSRGKVPFSAFTPSNTPDEIAGKLVEMVGQPTLPTLLEPILVSFYLPPENVAWPPVVAAILGRLQTSSPSFTSIDGGRLLSILERIATIEASGPAALKTLNDDGSLHGLLEIARRENNLGLAGLVLYHLIVQRGPQLSGPATHPQYGGLAGANEYISNLQTSPDDANLINDMAQHANLTRKFSDILVFSLPTNSDRELYRAILRTMVSLGNYNLIRVKDIITKTSRISEILGDDLSNKFIRRFDEWDISKDVSGDLWRALDEKFLSLSRNLSTRQYNVAVDAIRSGLEAWPAERWAESLKAEDDTIRLLFVLTDAGEALALGVAFNDGLKLHAQYLLDGGKAPIKYVAKWPKLAEVLSSPQRRQFSKWLRDRIIDKSPAAGVLRVVLSVFGPEFIAQADLFAKAEDVVRVMVDPLLADPAVGSLECLELHAAAFSGVLSAAAEEDKQIESKRVSALYEATPEDQRARIQALAATLGLSIELPMTPPGDEDRGIES